MAISLGMTIFFSSRYSQSLHQMMYAFLLIERPGMVQNFGTTISSQRGLDQPQEFSFEFPVRDRILRVT
jgi:hypothetical protein